jgi:four helix bundle protein
MGGVPLVGDECDPRDLRARTKRSALEIVRLYSSLPQTTEAQVLGRQLLRSGTSVGAHYREGVRGRSPAEFITKLEVGLQELEETGYWLELLTEAGVYSGPRVEGLQREAEELTAMLVSSVRTVKSRNQKGRA